MTTQRCSGLATKLAVLWLLMLLLFPFPLASSRASVQAPKKKLEALLGEHDAKHLSKQLSGISRALTAGSPFSVGAQANAPSAVDRIAEVHIHKVGK